MAGVVSHSGQLRDHGGDARQRPQDGGIPVGEGTPEQLLFHLAQLGGGELGFASGPPGRFQSRLALPLPGPVPVVHRGPARPQGARYLGSRLALRKEPGRLQPALLQTSEISSGARVQFHASDMP